MSWKEFLDDIFTHKIYLTTDLNMSEIQGGFEDLLRHHVPFGENSSVPLYRKRYKELQNDGVFKIEKFTTNQVKWDMPVHIQSIIYIDIKVTPVSDSENDLEVIFHLGKFLIFVQACILLALIGTVILWTQFLVAQFALVTIIIYLIILFFTIRGYIGIFKVVFEDFQETADEESEWITAWFNNHFALDSPTQHLTIQPTRMARLASYDLDQKEIKKIIGYIAKGDLLQASRYLSENAGIPLAQADQIINELK